MHTAKIMAVLFVFLQRCLWILLINFVIVKTSLLAFVGICLYIIIEWPTLSDGFIWNLALQKSFTPNVHILPKCYNRMQRCENFSLVVQTQNIVHFFHSCVRIDINFSIVCLFVCMCVCICVSVFSGYNFWTARQAQWWLLWQRSRTRTVKQRPLLPGLGSNQLSGEMMRWWRLQSVQLKWYTVAPEHLSSRTSFWTHPIV